MTGGTGSVTAPGSPGRTRVVRHVTCLGCGCACDDIEVSVVDGRIIEARRACRLGAAWFGDGRLPWRALVAGRPAAIEEAVAVATDVFADAQRPLIYLAPGLTCEAQREAVALADVLGAAIDSVTSDTMVRAVLAGQERGRASATLGEIRNRADVLIWWGVDPARRYPRYTERYAPDPAGLHVPDGRRSPTVIAVDIGDSRGPADADRRFSLSSEDEVATLAALLNETGPASGSAVEPGSIFERARELASAMKAARYCVLIADAEADPDHPARDEGRAEALIAVSQAFNGVTRCALGLLRGGGNRSGADAVLTWQTGYPCAVDFARGYPRYRPYDGTAARLLESGEVDRALVVGMTSLVPPPLLSSLSRIGAAIVGPGATTGALAGGTVAIDTGLPGVHDEGTALRMDDVPVRLRVCVPAVTDTKAIIRALTERIVAVHGTRRGTSRAAS